MSTLAPSQNVTSRDPKGLKFISIVEAQYNKAGLSDGPDGEAQRINDTALSNLADLIANFISEARRSDKFKGKEVRSSYTYPNEYKGPKPIDKQLLSLSIALNLDPASALEYATHLPALESFVPADALKWTGWFAVPSLASLATIAEKHFPEVKDMTERYCRTILFVFGKLAASRPFQNWREGQITSEQLRMTARLLRAMEILAETQKGDILIIAAQLGMRHRGRCTGRAREVFVANEVGLGSLMGSSIALTHPERFVRWEELDMDLPGDEFSPDADGQFVEAPILFVGDGGLRFGTSDVGGADGRCGSASFFLPQ